jgi:hypothetical protein
MKSPNKATDKMNSTDNLRRPTTRPASRTDFQR